MRRKIFSFAVLILLIGLVSTGCTSSAGSASSWPGFSVSEGAGYFAYSSQVYALDLKNGSLLWNYPQEASSGRQFYAAPAVSDDLVVVGDYANSLAALDKQGGFEKWQFTEAEDRYIGSALVENGYVYAPNSDHFLYALDENGDLMWRFKAAGPNWTKPLADTDNLYLVSMDHYIYALDFEYSASALETGEDGSRTLVSAPEWSLDIGSAVVADAVIDEGVLYVGTIDGTLYAVDLAGRKALWTFNADDELAAIWGSPVVVSDNVFVGDQDGNVYAISKATGKALWPTPFAAGSSIVSGGAALEESVVFATSEGKIFTINADKEPKTLTMLEATLNASLSIDDEKIILAPAVKDELFKAVDVNGIEIWNYLPAN